MRSRTVSCAAAPEFAFWSILALLTISCSGSSKSTTTSPVKNGSDAGTGGRSTAGTSGAADGGSSDAAGGGGRMAASAGAGGSATKIDDGDSDAGSDKGGGSGGAGAAGSGEAGSDAAVDAGSSGDAAAADGGGPPSATSVAAISMELGSAICDSLSACLGQQKLTALFSRESCGTREVSGLAENDLADLDDSVQKGRVTVHADLLGKCYDDTRALGCDVQTVRLPPSCQAAIEGHVAIGDVCSIGSDCSADAFCPTNACPRTCTARQSAGGSCGRDEECVAGLLCLSGACNAPAAIDTACAGDSAGVCPFGASCVGSTTSQAGTCKKNSDVQVGALGEACSPGGTLCQEGLSCAFDGASAFSCQGGVAAGQPCHLALPTECPVDQYCNAPDVMTAGQCVALPGVGSPCVLGDECAPGDLCVSEDSKSVCRRLADLGEDCTIDGLCRSGSCTAGKCAAPAVCP